MTLRGSKMNATGDVTVTGTRRRGRTREPQGHKTHRGPSVAHTWTRRWTPHSTGTRLVALGVQGPLSHWKKSREAVNMVRWSSCSSPSSSRHYTLSSEARNAHGCNLFAVRSRYRIRRNSSHFLEPCREKSNCIGVLSLTITLAHKNDIKTGPSVYCKIHYSGPLHNLARSFTVPRTKNEQRLLQPAVRYFDLKLLV